jgi:hypothetical protein
MKNFLRLKNKMYAAAAVALVAGAIMVALPSRAFAAAGLCYDALSGVTYKCPANAGTTKVDGKTAPNNKFDASKCYAFSDPSKGWEVADCNATAFQQVVTITPPIKHSDDTAGECIDGGSDQEGDCQIACPAELTASGGCDIVARYINPAINALTIVVGLIVTAAIATGGIQIAGARNNPQAIAAGKSKIANALIGFLGYSVLWAFLQWVVPGGFLNG